MIMIPGSQKISFYHVSFNILDVVESLCNKIELKLIQLYNTVGFKLA